MIEDTTKSIFEIEKSQEKNSKEEMTEAQKSADQITESVLTTLDESGHELDTEEDGNIFWVIQRIVWNILKSVFVIGIIGFLMWVIWGDMDISKIPSFSFSSEKNLKISKKEKEKKVKEKEKIPEKKIQNPVSIKAKTYQSVIAARWNIWMGEQYRKEVQDQIDKSVLLLQDFDDFFSTPLPLQIKGKNDQERASKIKILIQKIETLIRQYKKISENFSSEIAHYSSQLSPLIENSKKAESEFLLSVSERKPGNLEAYIQTKIHNGNKQFEIQNQVWAREFLLQEMKKYFIALETLASNIKLNEKALIHDVQVYDFLNDPFERVIR